MLKSVPIIGGSYSDDSRPYDQQECVNYLPELAQNANARAQGILRGVPGLVEVLDLGTVGESPNTGPGRGMRNVEGKLFIVQGSSLYEIGTSFVPTNRGAITGTRAVSMGHNQVAGGNQVTIVNGPDGFVWNTASEAFAQITDDAFVGSSVTGFIDGYMVQLDPLGKFWYHSDLVNALSYNSLNQYQAESDPDIISTLLVTHREMWAIGTNSIEQFVNAPNGNIIFQRQNGTIMEMGIAGPRTAVALDNTVYWLGNDGILYMAAGGYVPTRVSTFAFEQAIQGLDWSKAYAFAWTDRGHKVYYITFPDGYTWGYDISNGLMHRRASYGLDIWRINNLVFWNNDWYGTDFANGKVYRLDWDVYAEGANPLVSMRRSAYAHNNENRLFLATLLLVMDTGRGPVEPDSFVNIRYSDDGGFTYSNWRQKSINEIRNMQQRAIFRRLGPFRDRVFEIQISANVRRDLIAAEIQLTSET